MRLLFVSLVLCAQVAQAIDAYGFGQGTRAAIIGGASIDLNPSSALAQSAEVGATYVSLTSSIAMPGDLLLFHQTSLAFDAGRVELIDTNAGVYTFRRVLDVTGQRVTLDLPIDIRLEVPGAQAVVVAEVASLDISADAGVSPSPWDGRQGGIVALFVNGTLRNEGLIDASGRGLRGAPATIPPGIAAWELCRVGETVAAASKGEGVRHVVLGDATGVGSDGLGGGGGACRYAGGGGGGNAGVGGTGGMSGDGRPVGGSGGERVTASLLDRLLLGGGGGAGSAHVAVTLPGGAGGGIVYIRARVVTGGGLIVANGMGGLENKSSTAVGAGGGGAGGSVVMLSSIASTCSGVGASGGNGGDVAYCSGASAGAVGGGGGGGGGGRILLSPAGTSCTGIAPNGLGGRVRAVCGYPAPSHHGEPATQLPNHAGSVMEMVLPVIRSSPDGGSRHSAEWTQPLPDAVLSTRRPLGIGLASPGATVSVRLDGRPVALRVADLSGRFEYQPEVDLSDGIHVLEASVNSETPGTVTFRIETIAPQPPSIDAPAHQAFLAQSPATIGGTGPLGTEVFVLLDDQEVGHAPVAADGRWLLALDADSPLAEGRHSAAAWAKSASGLNSELSVASVFTIVTRLGKSEKEPLGVGCGCMSPATHVLLPLLLAWLLLRRRRAWAKIK